MRRIELHLDLMQISITLAALGSAIDLEGLDELMVCYIDRRQMFSLGHTYDDDDDCIYRPR